LYLRQCGHDPSVTTMSLPNAMLSESHHGCFQRLIRHEGHVRRRRSQGRRRCGGADALELRQELEGGLDVGAVRGAASTTPYRLRCGQASCQPSLVSKLFYSVASTQIRLCLMKEGENNLSAAETPTLFQHDLHGPPPPHRLTRTATTVTPIDRRQSTNRPSSLLPTASAAVEAALTAPSSCSLA
jgi:hypothetical protein